MESLEALTREHVIIREVLDCLERAADAARSEGIVDEELFLKAVEFIRDFVHGAHQAKEEVLDRRMAEAGLVGAPAREYDVLDFAGAIARALPGASQGDAAARRMLSENAKAYAGLVRSHVLGRRALLEAAGRSLTEEDDRALISLFAAVERELGEGTVEHSARLAGEIAERASLLPPRGGAAGAKASGERSVGDAGEDRRH